MPGPNVLGDFLRARRERIRPADVGLGAVGVRRVPGLRREEVALLAGISADYYLRLEQGRDRNPSTQVLAALARVLRLDADATAHLLDLARDRPARRTAPAVTVPDDLRELIAGWPTNPAYVQNRLLDVLAANDLAAALSPSYRPGVNLLEAVFLDPAERALRPDWESLVADGVAGLRAYAGPDLDDPHLTELVAALSERSDLFRRLWSRHEVQPQRGHRARFAHPRVGPLDLHSTKLTVHGPDDLVLVVFHATPGTPTAEALTRLGTLTPATGGSPTP